MEKNYGTMEQFKLWYRTENSETLIYYGKKPMVPWKNYDPIVN